VTLSKPGYLITRIIFIGVHGIAIGDTQRVVIASVDSLLQVVYRGERIHPWLWIFSKRKLQQAISSKNPNSRIFTTGL